MKFEDQSVAANAQQVSDLMSVVPFLSINNATAIIRFLKNLWKMQNTFAKRKEVFAPLLKMSEDEYKAEFLSNSIYQSNWDELYSEQSYEIDDKIEKQKADEKLYLFLEDNLPNKALLQWAVDESGYISSEKLQALAVKCFGRSIIDKVPWNGSTDEKIQGLGEFLGIPSEKVQSLANILTIFVGD